MAIGEPYPWMNNQLMYNAFPPPQGWQCPVCGAVYAPTVLKCFTKHRKPKDQGMTTTIRNSAQAMHDRIFNDNDE